MLLTRPNRSPDLLLEKLNCLGADGITHPLITFSDPSDRDHVTAVLSRLDGFSIAAFLSQQAAIAFCKHNHPHGASTPRFASMGIGTRNRLRELGHEAPLVPEKSNSESMAELLIEEHKKTGSPKPILILRANRGSDVLPNALRLAGIPFEELAIYESHDVTKADPAIEHDLADGKFDWLTITSSAIARNVAKLFADHLGHTKIVSISPTTTKAAMDAGLTVAAEATDYNMDGLVDAIVRYEET